MSESFDDEPRRPAHSAGSFDFGAVLDEIADVIERAKSVPLSSSVMISKDEVMELLKGARELLPSELQRARRVLVDAEEVRLRAAREAAALLDEARSQAAHLVQRTEIVRQARHEAERIIAEAQSEARRTEHAADDYVDRKLASFEIVLDRTMRTVQAGRERLSTAPPKPEEEDQPISANGPHATREGLFDQDIS